MSIAVDTCSNSRYLISLQLIIQGIRGPNGYRLSTVCGCGIDGRLWEIFATETLSKDLLDMLHRYWQDIWKFNTRRGGTRLPENKCVKWHTYVCTIRDNYYQLLTHGCTLLPPYWILKSLNIFVSFLIGWICLGVFLNRGLLAVKVWFYRQNWLNL